MIKKVIVDREVSNETLDLLRGLYKNVEVFREGDDDMCKCGDCKCNKVELSEEELRMELMIKAKETIDEILGTLDRDDAFDVLEAVLGAYQDKMLERVMAGSIFGD